MGIGFYIYCLESSIADTEISLSNVYLLYISFINYYYYYFLHFTCLVTFLSLFTCQAERELQPWIAKDDDLGQKMWRINQRIVKLIVELMRNDESAESLVIVASSSDLLLRATDGMLVDGEACTLPQLEVVCFNISFSIHILALNLLNLLNSHS